MIASFLISLIFVGISFLMFLLGAAIFVYSMNNCRCELFCVSILIFCLAFIPVPFANYYSDLYKAHKIHNISKEAAVPAILMAKIGEE